MADTPSPQARLMQVEAARYALLRRLAGAMRHQLVMHLQPIGMLAEVMTRRLAQPVPDLAQVNDGVQKISGYSRSAVDACLDVITWLAPDPAATLTVDEAAAECLELLRSSLGFRGFTLRSAVSGQPRPVGRTAVRLLLAGALLALADEIPAPAELVLDATCDETQALLAVAIRPGAGAPPGPGNPAYRALRWDEVMALADAEGVRVERLADRITLAFDILD